MQPGDVRLVNGVGSTGSTASRRDIYDRFTREGYCFATVIHPSAIVAPEVQIEDGVQIMAGAILQAGSSVGSNAIVNTGAIIDHDCVVGAHAHIAPGAVLSGGVHVGSGAHIGTGACIIQGVSIGAASVVGAGAVVIKDVPPGVTTVGVPAKTIDKNLATKSHDRPVSQMPKTVYIVHCLDTEGPLHESIEATFERIREIFHLDFEPSVELLRRLQEGKVDCGGAEAAIQKMAAPHLLAYNDTWDKIDRCCAMRCPNHFELVCAIPSVAAGFTTGSVSTTLITILIRGGETLVITMCLTITNRWFVKLDLLKTGSISISIPIHHAGKLTAVPHIGGRRQMHYPK